ncbi:hypothetical protein CYMTET_53318, partial [Cymbomonas tetramitiformis]
MAEDSESLTQKPTASKSKHTEFNGDFSAWTGDAGVSFACIQQHSIKNEDRIFLHSTPVEGVCDAVAAVFDGHNSSAAADYASENLLRELCKQCDRLLAASEVEAQRKASPKDDAIRAVSRAAAGKFRPDSSIWPCYMDDAVRETFKE